MSHVIIANFQPPPPASGNDTFAGIWKLTRGLLAAGWKYRASGDATATGTKDTSGVANTYESAFASDKWGVDGGVNLNSAIQTGSSLSSITAATDGTATITFSGTTFTASSVGRFLSLSGDSNNGNNGNFRITTFTSATSIKVFNPGAVTEATPTVTAWKELEGGANGSLTASGSGGAQPARAIFSVSSGTPFVLPTTSPTVTRGSTGDRLTIIGAATAGNNGTFRITRVISTTSVEIDYSAATTDGNNGSLHWVECSPTAQIYPGSINAQNGIGAWWCGRGPSMMKIPIGTNTSTGTFQKYELVTQTTSGATGAIVGIVTDTVGGAGFLVIEPRLNGSGTGPRGWTSGSTDTVSAQAAPTGSGATITSSTSAPVEYVYEIVFWKGSLGTQGHQWIQCVDQSGESASLYSQLALAGGVTNTIAPGGASGTFPATGSWVVYGTGGSGAGSTGQTALYWSISVVVGLNHALCANCIETATTSADGSFWSIFGYPASNALNGSYIANGFQRCQDSEDGDVSPYVTVGFPSSENYNGSRTAQTTTSVITDFFSAQATISAGNNYSNYRGWRKRGFASGDAWQEFGGWNSIVIYNSQSVSNYNINSGTGRVMHNPSSTPQPIREPIWIISSQTSQKMRKGTLRWLYQTEGGVSGQLFGSATNDFYIQVRNPGFSSTQNDGVVIGPWDGFSEPKVG